MEMVGAVAAEKAVVARAGVAMAEAARVQVNSALGSAAALGGHLGAPPV